MNSTAESPATQTEHPIMDKLGLCTHEKFHIFADINKLDNGVNIADMRIVCVQCGTPFCFVGVPVGVSFNFPCVSADCLELHAPIVPAPKIV